MDNENTTSAIEAFDAYYCVQDKVKSGKYNELGIEVRKRLVQAKTIFGRVIGLQHEGEQIPLGPPRPPDGFALQDWMKSDKFETWNKAWDTAEWREKRNRQSEIVNELELQTECFYWIAGRARTIIKLMPGLETFEAVGVRNVRNKLIEHPEKGDSGVTIGSFAWGAQRIDIKGR